MFEERTVEEIQEMIDTLKAALDDLPDESAFGDSNAAEKAEIKGWIGQLEGYKTVIESGEYPKRDFHSEPLAWMWRYSSALNDFTS